MLAGLYAMEFLCIIYMGVDQNKGIWGSYNHRSTVNQPRSQWCQSREGSVVGQNIATCHSI